ncbi:MAG: N-acetylgalactosamine-6-sulfatase [Verrucomicrobiales bacterium]|nr:N-acetylgalactosamine-6-sulfatase [Verrucomicrobiales bacterium]
MNRCRPSPPLRHPSPTSVPSPPRPRPRHRPRHRPRSKSQSGFRLLILLSLLLLSLPSSQLRAETSPGSKKTNLVFILADDLGWADTTLYGQTKYYKTPHLECLAKRGMTFTRAYSASPLCSPTRASILTGLSPARLGLTTPNCHLPQTVLQATPGTKAPPGNKAVQPIPVTRLNTTYPTLAKTLRDAGYATGHFGKWHLGPEPFSPLQHGFDLDLPHTPGPGPAGSYVAPWKFKNFDPDPAIPDQHIEDRMAKEAVSFLEKNQNRPFFLNYWMFSVHAPFDAKKPLIEKYRATAYPADPQHSPTYAAMVESMDNAVGTLMDTLDRLHLTDSTLIVFLSDNGGNMYDKVDNTSPTSNAPLRGGKATVYEGGIRVPCLISLPGLTAPGSRNESPIQSTDFFPTLLDALQLPTPPDVAFDGISLLPALKGQALPSRPLFTYFPHDPPVPDWLPPSATVTEADWKLIRLFFQGENGAHRYQLYNLQNDPGEKTNLAPAEPDRVQRMDALLESWLTANKTVLPIRNPQFDPAKYHPENEGRPAPKPPAKPKKPAPSPPTSAPAK